MDRASTAEDDIIAIKKVGEEYFQATSEGELERCLATMATDVVCMPPGRPSIFGREELRRASSRYHANYEASYALTYDEVWALGDIGFARATVAGTRKSKLDGSIETVVWRNLWILKRQADGDWKFWRIIFNSPL